MKKKNTKIDDLLDNIAIYSLICAIGLIFGILIALHV